MKLSKDKLEGILTNIGYSKVGGIPDCYRIKDGDLIDVGKVDTVEELCATMFVAGNNFCANQIKNALQIR